MLNHPLTRRDLLAHAGTAALGASLLGTRSLFAEDEKPAADKPPAPCGKAEHCIFIWLGGGCAQIDTFDPKRKSESRKQPGSAYDAIDTAVKGVQVCEYLKRTAPLLERCVLVRTVHHNAFDEHAAATNLMHTGRPTSGTIIYPSIGSIVTQQRGPAGDGVPPYVVMGYPNVTRGPGFLGAKHGYVYLTETEVGPSGLKRPDAIGDTRAARRESLRDKVRAAGDPKLSGDPRAADYAAAIDEGRRLSSPAFMSAFDLKAEPGSLRDDYGAEFGQRLLLARRLIERGVRFIEVASNLNFTNGTGWDTHNEGQLGQHLLIDELDRGFGSLVVDLEKHKLLDKTLIVIGTEFGRPPEFDGGGGRGHQSKAFSCVLAGGGLKTGRAIGETDELSKKIAERPVSVPDLHATIHATLGIDPALELYDGDRPVPLTDRGQPIAELFA